MSESAFWRFSLDFYARPAVAPLCLALQDECGADVNVLLYLLFAAANTRALDDTDLDAIESVANEWRTAVVLPLRTLRRRLRHPVGVFPVERTEPLRSDIKRIELAAERLQQETLEQHVPVDTLGHEAATAMQAARINLALYARRLGAGATAAMAPLNALFDAGLRGDTAVN